MISTKNIKLIVDRDSVHPADDFDSHAVSTNFPASLNLLEMLDIALSKCQLPKITGGNATWIIYHHGKEKSCLGVIAQQWSSPALLLPESMKLESSEIRNGDTILFRYWCQSDPEQVLKAIKSGDELPNAYQ